MALHWIIPFKNISDDEYIIKIYDDAFTDSYTSELIGAAHPITTEEDDEPDLFLPVRTQSGYISIADTGFDESNNAFNWRNLIPSSATARPIELVRNNTVYWRGYLQPQTFSGPIFELPVVRKFAICCPLAALYSFWIDNTRRGKYNFGAALYHIFSFINIANSDKFYFSCNSSSSIIAWLQRGFLWDSLIDSEGRATHTAGALLEEICKVFGWSCRMYRKDIYFTSPDDSYTNYPFYSFTYAQLASIGSGSVSPTNVSWTTTTLSGNIFANKDNEEEYLQGVCEARVTADIQSISSFINLKGEYIEKILNAQDNIVSTFFQYSRYHLYRRDDYSGYVPTGSQRGYIKREDKDVCYEFDVYWSSSDYSSYGVFMQDCWVDSVSDLHDIPFDNIMRLYHNVLYRNGEVFASFRTYMTYPISLSDGVLVIRASTFYRKITSDGPVTENGYGSLVCRLRIGNQYWNGSSWISYSTSFTIPNVGGTAWASGQGEIESNRVLNNSYQSPYPNYKGYGVPIGSTPIAGILEFEIFDYVPGGPDHQTATLFMPDFEIAFLKESQYQDFSDASQNVYIKQNMTHFEGKVDISTIFPSYKNNMPSKNFILNTDYSYCDEIEFYGGRDRPEQHLVNRIANYGAAVRRKCLLSLRDDVAYWPTPLVKTVFDGSTMYPVAISHDWREGVIRTTLMELPT